MLTLAMCAPPAVAQRLQAASGNRLQQHKQAPPKKVQIEFKSPPDEMALTALRVAPTIVWTTVAARKKGSIEFYLANGAPHTKAAVYLQLLSFLPAEDGWPYNLVATHPHDATPWFAPPQAYVLGPGKSLKVPLDFTVPAGTKGCYWTLLKVTPHPTLADSVSPDNADANQEKLGYYVPIFIKVGVTRPAMMVISEQDCKRQHPNDAFNSVGVTLNNDSEGVSLVGIEGEVRNTGTGVLVQKSSITDRILLPRSRRRLFMPAFPLPDGQYRAKIRVVQDLRRLTPIVCDFEISGGNARMLTPDALLSVAPVIVNPSGVNLSLKPGGRGTQLLSLTNNTDRPLHLLLTPCPVKQSRDGAIGPEEGSLPTGLNIVLSPAEVTLTPGRGQNVRITAELTRQAEGQLWFGASITEVDNPHSVPEHLLGNILVVGDPKPQPPLDLNGNIEMQDGRPTALHLIVRNSGNMGVTPGSSATLLKANDKTLVAEIPVPDWNGQGMLPGSELETHILLPSPLTAGQYILVVKYANQANVTEKEFKFQVAGSRPIRGEGSSPRASAAKPRAK